MSETPSQGFAPVSGGKLYFERRGEGPALVLIHSAYLDCRMWDPQFETYGRRCTVVRYDVRGHGRSTADRSGSSDVDDLIALLDHLDLPKVYLLGNSDGARIACEFAAGLPDRVRGLIIVAGNPPDLDPTREEEVRFMDTFPQRGQRLLELAGEDRRSEAIDLILEIWAPAVPAPYRERLRTITAENYERFIELFRHDASEAHPPAYPVATTLEEGRVPLLSISGAHDNPALNMMMGRFAQKVPGGRHVELAAGDHTPSLSALTEFDSVVLEFLFPSGNP